MNPVADPVPQQAPSEKPVVRPDSPRQRLGPYWLNAIVALVGPPWLRRLAHGAIKVPRIRHWEKEYERLSDADLKTTGQRCAAGARRRIAGQAVG